MKMKLKTIVAACALAFAGQAAALPPSTASYDVTMFVSGSSALYTMIGQVATSMFEPGTIDVMWDGTATTPGGKSYRAYSGRANAAAIAAYPSLESATPGVGKTILMLNRSAGGSIQGVNPVATSTAIASLNLATCGAAATAVIDPATALPIWSCTGTQNRIPDAGISDVEPIVLESAVNLGSATALTTSQLQSLSVQGVLGVVMASPSPVMHLLP